MEQPGVVMLRIEKVLEADSDVQEWKQKVDEDRNKWRSEATNSSSS